MLTHEVFIHQVIIDGIKPGLMPRAIHAIFATSSITTALCNRILGIFTPCKRAMLIDHNARRM